MVRVKIQSRDGTEETIDADAYLPTFGMQPNTAFLPPEMLDSKGFVQQTPFLRARGYDNIFVVGDAGNLQPLTAANADKQAVHVVKNIEAFLSGSLLTKFNTEGYIQFAVAMGDRGTGQLGSWKVWSILVWLVKGRYLGTQYAGGIAAGDRTMLSRHW
jgi:NADH dehydrogenase FAD-containing subunit